VADDSDEMLATAAASGVAAVASSALVGSALAPRPPTPPLDGEMAMPRWRRPSLLEARKADPLRRTAPPDPRLTFAAAAPVAGHERRRIRYRVVRLLDGPDELTALDIGVLDEGDEVQLIERSGVYWFVLCPDGSQGWVHRMVLGDAVDEPVVPGPAARATSPRDADGSPLAVVLARARPTAPGPATADGAADVGDIDEDVLVAYLAARGRA
jgi:hypothetical protein